MVGAPFCVITLYAAIPIFPRTSVLLEIKRRPLPVVTVDMTSPTAEVILEIELANGVVFVRYALAILTLVSVSEAVPVSVRLLDTNNTLSALSDAVPVSVKFTNDKNPLSALSDAVPDSVNKLATEAEAVSTSAKDPPIEALAPVYSYDVAEEFSST